MNKPEGSKLVIEGAVIITRYPLLHPGDIRVLKAVQSAVLDDFFGDSCSGIVLFSTKGVRSSASEMSGGDFDGKNDYNYINSSAA